jgi:hypothetical protein
MVLGRDELTVGGPASGKVYKPDWGLRLALGFGAVLCLVLGLTSVWIAAAPSSTAAPQSVVTGMIACTFMGASGLFLLCLLKWATVLYPDRVEARGPLRIRSLPKIEIAGYRLVKPRNGLSYMKLIPKRADLKPVSVYIFRQDAAFDRWFAGFPDLDAADLAEAEERLMAQVNLGATPFEREARLARLKTIARVFTVAACAVAGWVWLWPKPYGLALSLALAAPLIMLALVWWSKGLLSIITAKTDPRPNVGAAFLLGFLLLQRAFDHPILDPTPAIILGLVVGLVLLSLIAWLDPKARTSRALLGGVLFALAYGWSAVIIVDRLADSAPAKSFQTEVLEKWTSSGRSRSWNIKLAAWGPLTTDTTMSIASDAYDRLAIGQTVCVGLHPGALGVRWYALTRCRGEEPKASRLPEHSSSPFAQTPSADDMAGLYPELAKRDNLEGRAKFRCVVADGGVLTNCVILSETPEGYGFGDATLKVTKMLKMAPVDSEGRSTAGQTFTSSVVWRLPTQTRP